MKFWSSEHIFNHCWDRVTQAVWRKYPNDLNPNVKTMDVLDRRVDEEGRLHTLRLVGSEGFLPSWVCNMIGVNNLCYAYEHSVVDPVKKTMVMGSRNMTLSGFVNVEETLTYSQHEDNDRTRLTQDAIIKVFGISFKDYFEGLIKSTMASNASKGRQAMEMVIGKINKEVQDFATNIEQATSRLNSEFEQATSRFNTELEQAKQGLEQASLLPQAFCEGSTSKPSS
ncbi:PRELI domain containing protein 3B-like [Montipora capricornis]|uniref:PRELI domain containing protein 3B-like n=1 Tax=Montipora capricornis TaxID=246305 RepID=UPI0035F198B8